MRAINFAGALAAALLFASAANADALFDNFDGENGGAPVLNYSPLANFAITSAAAGGRVDLIGSGTGGSAFDFFPGNGLYLDVCGTGSQCAVLTSNLVFSAGTYDVTLGLAGNARSGTSDGTTVSFGSYSDTVMLTTSQFLSYTFSTTLSSASAITIGDLGLDGSQVGNILLSVNIAPSRSTAPTGVPEPLTLSIFGAGLAGAAALRRRRAKA